MKIRATIISRSEEWLTIRFEIAWDGDENYEVLGIRPQIYSPYEWSLVRGLFTVGCRKANVEFIERSTT